MAKDKLDINRLFIAPLADNKTSGVFPMDDKEFRHIIKWFESDAFTAQREKKSKTYVAIYDGKVIAFVAISMNSVKTLFGSTGKTRFAFPVLLVGKLYTHPEYRGMGVGKELLSVAVGIALEIDQKIGCAGLLVDANNNPDTIRFYKKYGFEDLVDGEKGPATTPMFLIIPEDSVTPETL